MNTFQFQFLSLGKMIWIDLIRIFCLKYIEFGDFFWKRLHEYFNIFEFQSQVIKRKVPKTLRLIVKSEVLC